ncbi:MAG: transporter substrate-binding domain-containing protein [Spirochaetales bacterium]|nr:transporter substrate-binding domain-containing protein [Spirochaetales bacterium]
MARIKKLLKLKALFLLFIVLARGLPLLAQRNNLSLSVAEEKWLLDRNEIIVGIMDAWPPMDFVTKDGLFQGIGADFVRLMNTLLGNRLKMVAGSWHEIYEKCLKGEIDALMDISDRPERADFFNFTQIYVDIPHLIIAPENGPYYKNMGDLANTTLAAERGYGIVNYVRRNHPDIIVREYDSTSDALDAVAKGEAQAYIGNRAVAKYIIDRELLSGLQFQSKVKATKSSNSIGVRKDLPLLVSILDKAISAIPEEQKLAVFRKWSALSDQSILPFLTSEESFWIQEHNIVRVAADSNWAPVEYLDKNGKIQGISRDFLDLISMRTGLSFEMMAEDNWSATVEKVKQRKMDMYSAVVKTPERSQYMDFTEPYIGLFNVIFTREKNQFYPDLNELADQNVAVVKGYAIEEFLQNEYPSIRLISVEDVIQGLNYLSTGKVIAYIDTLLTTSFVIQQKGFANIKVAGNTPFQYDLSMAVRKDWPVLGSILSKALASISDEDKNQIFRKWRSITVEERFDYNVLWRVLLPVLLSLCVLVFWIYRLRVEIVKRKRAESELLLAKDHAEKANNSKSVFLANMSHEIRTPMNAILGYSQILLSDKNLEMNQREHIKAIFRSGNHLLGLINEVLDMAKVEAGKIVIHKSPFSLITLLRECYEMFKLRAEEKELQFTMNLNVPEYVYSDKNRVRQIIINLIGNAIKFTENGMIEVNAEVNNNEICIEIKDTGIGIAEKDLERIFNAFEQVEGVAQKGSGGTGLGLAISKKMAELLDGKLTVSSRLGCGSSFKLCFSNEKTEMQVQEEPKKSYSPLRLTDEYYNTKVLITDDRKENRDVVKKLLLPFGFDIRESSNGNETLIIIEQWKPRLLLLDIIMPDMKGFQVIEHLRKEDYGKNLAIIAMSASVIDVQREEILRAGADAFVQKPFFIDVLLEQIRLCAALEFVYDTEDSKNRNNAYRISEGEVKLDKLPVELVERIFKASIIGDIEALAMLVSEVKKIDKKASDFLNQQIEEFRLESIQKVFHN